MRSTFIRRLALATAVTCIATAAMAAPVGNKVTRQIPGPDGGWDYASVDSAHRMLYVAHDKSVMSMTLDGGNRVANFGAVAHAHAVVPIAGRALLLVTSGQDGTVRLFDTRSHKQVASIAVGEDPDAAIYNAATGEAAVMNAKSGTVSIIDVANRKVARTIALKPGLEFAQFGAGGTLFVNNEDANSIATANPATGGAGPTIALLGCTGPSGLGYDDKTAQLISACDNGKAAVVDARTMKLTHLIDIGAGPDAVIMDPAHRRAFIPCGQSGTLIEIALDGPQGAHATGTVTTAAGARTGAIDPKTGTIYLPTATAMAPPPGQHRAYKPSSFRVLVVSD
ncbi:YncE family protein [Sphingomonas koreensis]|nr:YncE family protein [Sphingomonas koreensis]